MTVPGDKTPVTRPEQSTAGLCLSEAVSAWRLKIFLELRGLAVLLWGMSDSAPIIGRLSAAAGQALPLQVCFSRAGYYLGTHDENGPVSRESVEY